MCREIGGRGIGRWGAGGWLCVCREMGGRGMVVCV